MITIMIIIINENKKMRKVKSETQINIYINMDNNRLHDTKYKKKKTFSEENIELKN